MVSVVIIAGTPGVGKTAVGRRIAKVLDGVFIDIPEFTKKNNLYEYYDRGLGTYVVDERKLEKKINETIKGLGYNRVVLASHIIPKIEVAHEVKVVVIRLNPLLLIKRLKRRRYSSRKIVANVESEFIGVVYNDAVKIYGVEKVIQVDSTCLNIADTVGKILRFLKKGQSDDVDWLTTLSDYEIDKLLKFLTIKTTNKRR